MPYVNIQVTREGVSASQKAELIKGTTDLLQDVLGKGPGDHIRCDRRSRPGKLGHWRIAGGRVPVPATCKSMKQAEPTTPAPF